VLFFSLMSRGFSSREAFLSGFGEGFNSREVTVAFIGKT
jgi:hypothetical protein